MEKSSPKFGMIVDQVVRRRPAIFSLAGAPAAAVRDGSRKSFPGVPGSGDNSLSSGGRARPARQRSLPRPCDRFPGVTLRYQSGPCRSPRAHLQPACRTSRSVPARSPAAFLPPAAAARPVPSVAAPVPVWRVSATRCLPSSNGKIVAPPPRRTKYETAICESPPKTLIHQRINSPCEVPGGFPP